MSAAQHTPGPWRLDHPDCWGGTFVETAAPGIDGREVLICSLYDRQSAFPPDDDEKRANGHLIAAAPELLAALIEAVDLMGRNDFATLSHLPKYRAAIAKATGSAA